VALKTDGTLWSWGHNDDGQLGNGTTDHSSILVQESTGASDWSSVVNGELYTIALKTDGTLWSWGSGNKGQLGNGNTNDSSIPVQEATGTYWSSVVVGGSYTVALK